MHVIIKIEKKSYNVHVYSTVIQPSILNSLNVTKIFLSLKISHQPLQMYA